MLLQTLLLMNLRLKSGIYMYIKEKSKSQFEVEVTRLMYVRFCSLCSAYSIDTPTDFY